MLDEAELSRRIEAAGRIRRWYQAVPYGDVKYGHHFDDGRTNPRSYGDGRWAHYIRPAIARIEAELDPPRSALCEVGCSAGLFLLRAWEQFGFRRLIGVEAGRGAYEQLRITADYYDAMPLRTHLNRVGRAEPNIADDRVPPLDLERFPIVDLTLLSCVHYHMQEQDLREYLRALSRKSLFLLVVTDENAGHVTRPDAKFAAELAQSTGRWQLVAEDKTPAEWLRPPQKPPCKDLTALTFRSAKLRRLPTEECFEQQIANSAVNRRFYTRVFPAFIDGVLAGRIKADGLKGTQVYRCQTCGGGRCDIGAEDGQPPCETTAWPPDVAVERTMSYYQMVHSMHDHGQEQPIRLLTSAKASDPWDGHHRVGVAHHLGLPYVYGA